MSKRTKIVIAIIIIVVLAYGIFQLGWFGLVAPKPVSGATGRNKACLTPSGSVGTLCYTVKNGITYTGCCPMGSAV